MLIVIFGFQGFLDLDSRRLNMAHSDLAVALDPVIRPWVVNHPAISSSNMVWLCGPLSMRRDEAMIMAAQTMAWPMARRDVFLSFITISGY